MKKWVFVNSIACASPAIMVTITCGCSEKDSGFTPGPDNVSATDRIAVTPAGGTIKALNGNVTFNFPVDAVSQSTNLAVGIIMPKSVKESTSIKSSSGFALKAILIEPGIVFNKPVQVSLKCDGYLWNGVTIQEGMNLSASIWESIDCFLNNEVACICTSCLLNPDQETISMCICQGGVIAVQIN